MYETVWLLETTMPYTAAVVPMPMAAPSVPASSMPVLVVTLAPPIYTSVVPWLMIRTDRRVDLAATIAVAALVTLT